MPYLENRDFLKIFNLEEEQDCIKDIRYHVKQNVDDIIHEFYNRLGSNSSAMQFFKDENHIKNMITKTTISFVEMFNPPNEPNYFEDNIYLVSKAHHNAGVPLSLYTEYLEQLRELIKAKLPEELHPCLDTMMQFFFSTTIYYYFKIAHESLDKEKIQNEILIRTIVHDLSNPLTIVKAKYERKPDDRKAITRSLNVMVDIVSSIKDLMSANLGHLNLEPHSIKSILIAAKSSFQAKAESKEICIEIDLQTSEQDCIEVDKNIMIHQVLGNLVSNSIKFSHPKSKIKLTSRKEDQHIFIEVIDYGIGIPAQKHDKLFKFEEKTSSLGLEGEKGTGFGLPIVKIFTESMHGTISFSSSTEESSQGTAFILKFPC